MAENTTTTRKWSSLRGIAVVAIDSGKKVGTVEDFYFGPQSNNVQALLIKTSLFGQRVLLTRTITGVGIDAVTFPKESELVKEKDAPELLSCVSGKSLQAYRVLSEGGNLIGTIGNIILDISKPNGIGIATFELAGGLREHITRHYPSFDAYSVTRYGQDVMVIPDAVAEALK